MVPTQQVAGAHRLPPPSTKFIKSSLDLVQIKEPKEATGDAKREPRVPTRPQLQGETK